MLKSSKSRKVTKSSKPAPFSDSFTTAAACLFSVEVKCPWGESVEDIEVKIDGGLVHGDEDTIDLFIQMLEQARENLVARRGELTRYRFVRARGTAK